MSPSSSLPLPLKHPFSTSYALSLVIAAGLAVASIAGLLYPAALYATAEMRQSYVPNDAVNLVVGLPILLGSLWLAGRGRLLGLLCWPGALLYTLYNYTAYAFGRPPDWLTLVYLALVLLCAYVIVALLWCMDRSAIKAQLAGKVPRKTAGWVLVLFGGLFFVRSLGVVAGAWMNRAPLAAADIGLLVADTILAILCMSGGVLLLRRLPLGYASGLGLLFAASMLFAGLIVLFLLRPVLTDVPFDLTEVLVVLVMGLFCFIPLVLYGRGVGL